MKVIEWLRSPLKEIQIGCVVDPLCRVRKEKEEESRKSRYSSRSRTTNSSFLLQAEISKRLNAIIGQILPFLSQEHQQQVATAVDRAKQVTMTELNSIIGVSAHHAP